jgi:3-oxoacyl-[acyl-carrier protein] reductase
VTFHLDGKNALVTGGTRGTGRAITLALARAGANVVCCYQQDEAASETLRQELKGIGQCFEVVAADVCESESVASLAATCAATLGGLDIVVNNVGVYSMISFDDLELSDWKSTINTNLRSVYMIVRAALPLLGVGSSIVNVGAAVAVRGLPARAHFTASKAAITGLTRSLCKELGPAGIRINTVAPGIIESRPYAGMPEELYEHFRKMTALGRMGTPEEVADAVLFFASDLSRYVTGVTLDVDGGI